MNGEWGVILWLAGYLTGIMALYFYFRAKDDEMKGGDDGKA